VLASPRPLRHAARLPKAFRELHGNGVLDGRVGKEVRLREAIARGLAPRPRPNLVVLVLVLVLVLGLNLLLLLDHRLLAPGRWRAARRSHTSAMAVKWARPSSVDTVPANSRHSRASSRYSCALLSVTAATPFGC
jgi:hypothetical protein